MFYSPLMKTLKALLFLAVATSTSFAADKIKVALTNQQAVNLYNALGSISPGLSPVDTIIAADDINVLEKVATDFMKGQQKALRLAQEVKVDDPSKLTKQAAILLPIEALGDTPVAVDKASPGIIAPGIVELTPLDISTDEIKDAKIPAINLSVLRKYLQPPPPKP